MESMLISNSSEISKSYIEEKANLIISKINDGLFNEIEVYQLIRGYEELLEKVEKGIKENVISEIEKYDKEDRNFGNISFQISNSGDRLDYEKDPEYKKIKKSLKDRETLLKTAYNLNKSKSSKFQEKTTIVDEETGETIPVVPIKTFSGKVLKCTIK